MDLLIRALPYVRRAVPDAHVLVAGDGPHRKELEDLARQLSVDDRVVFAGSVPESDFLPRMTPWMFSLCPHTLADGEWTSKVWASSSWKLAAGVLILVGDSGGSVDAVQDGVTGNLIGTNPEAIAAEIVELALYDKLEGEMGPAVVNGWWTVAVGRPERRACREFLGRLTRCQRSPLPLPWPNGWMASEL